MTRFAWLQTRTQTLTVAVALAALAVAAAITGIQLSGLYHSLVVPCVANGDCGTAIDRFLSRDSFLQDAFLLLMRVAPALVGIFWGAPLLAREFETGSYRLAWTQSVTRSRWLVTRFVTGLVAAAATVAALTLLVTWWSRALDHVEANQYGVFDARNIAPIGYAVFAFSVGALAGAVIRRTLPAMATTLGVFVVARVVMTVWVRSHLFPARHAVSSLLNADGFGFIARNGGPVDLVARAASKSNAWLLKTQLVTNSGQVATAADRKAFVSQYCNAIAHPGPNGHALKDGAPAAFDACRNHAAQTFHLLATYQPASRYWAFQWAETGIFVALAAICAGACYWWITRRTG